MLLDIHRIQILSGEAETADLRWVRCPSAESSVTLEACLECGKNAGVAREPADHAERVSCTHEAGAHGARMGAARRDDRVPVTEIMTADVLAVRPDVSLETLTTLFLERGIGGIPVVDDAGRPVGVVSKTDLVERQALAGDTGEALEHGPTTTEGRLRVELGAGVHAEAIADTAAEDVMSHRPLTVPEATTVAQAAALMAARGVHRLLVVSGDGRLSGIVTASDLVRRVAGVAGPRPMMV